MLFNSIDFAIFLPLIFILYWFVLKNSLKLQNLLIVIASYIFYGWWDWRFLTLIVFSTLVDYAIGRRLKSEENDRRRLILLWTSILVNLGFLGFFKYYNFFLDNFVTAFSFFGRDISANSLDIILPVGISFYTFQTLSYTIDVYKRKLEPTENLIDFAAFVSFFPQLVAGPIERATHLLPQFYKPRTFDYYKAVDGMRQILWGLFKKIVIADNCAYFANQIFNNSTEMNGSTLMLGPLFFAFQIYGDFSGYSDIAIGTSRLFGFDLMQNFNFPYFSRDFAEYWRRWHISLSTWFRDYLYIPLGGSKGGLSVKIRNTFIIFIVSGFWHGANWTYVIWGALNAVFFLPLLLTNSNRSNLETIAKGKLLPGWRDSSLMVLTLTINHFAWIVFRSENLTHMAQYFSGIFSASFFEVPEFEGMKMAALTMMLVLIFMSVEWLGREGRYAIEKFGLNWKRPVRHAFYYMIIAAIIWFGGEEQQFIYFQF
ncbi:MAG: MBOAT family O-acyltransferase [Cyclobacteriaceae bacterium]